MHWLLWIKNTLRNYFRGTFLGRVFKNVFRKFHLQRIHIVSATRLSSKDFWRHSALGKSLKSFRDNPLVTIDIKFENTDGLPKVYNERLRTIANTDVFIFVHDDVWIDDREWLPKVTLALQHFDIVGVAGNTRFTRQHAAWMFKNEKFEIDYGYLSGAVGHGMLPNGRLSEYGPSPIRCQLLDGVFMAVRQDYVRSAKLLFDERFDFHLYDMDFCRVARKRGLSMGTWPIALTHQSKSIFNTPAWISNYARYIKKWGK